MPHSSFKTVVKGTGAGVGKCSCGQMFECGSEREYPEYHQNQLIS